MLYVQKVMTHLLQLLLLYELGQYLLYIQYLLNFLKIRALTLEKFELNLNTIFIQMIQF